MSPGKAGLLILLEIQCERLSDCLESHNLCVAKPGSKITSVFLHGPNFLGIDRFCVPSNKLSPPLTWTSKMEWAWNTKKCLGTPDFKYWIFFYQYSYTSDIFILYSIHEFSLSRPWVHPHESSLFADIKFFKSSQYLVHQFLSRAVVMAIFKHLNTVLSECFKNLENICYAY